ncbi:monosaccharide ABC transporter membrane protein, CUT2 family [Natronincola peptidivorans]|uniref:Monosaccharide ABC transporter membrane protein, CUT2 family n=1 Tax=Natronincola peptidivorans TaxID=426128 RepID=A0A1I0CDB2_9FIRM|nr:ABC transporter permease [Natronincola peptidivorans]SET17277.1 monosaccharide ABC transporter membrane protein, CUT2 family [Natronincola peptidivorans]
MRIENITKPINNKNFKKIYKEYSYVFSFIILVIIAIAVNKQFLTYSNLSTLIMQSSIKGIIALGMTLVIISGEIDLSVGSTCALVAGLGVVVLNSTESIFIMLVFCIVFGTILGTINGLFIRKGKIASFIVTLATMSAYRSIIVQLGQGGPFNVSSEMYPTFRMIASGKILGIPNLAIIFIVISVGIAFLMQETKFGKYVYAVGSNENASKLTGIHVDRIKILCFSITGLLTGVSAFLLSSRLTSITAPNAAMSFELDAIAAVAIGGTAMSGGRGKIFGTFLGIIMLQMIEGILIAAKIPPFLNGLVKGVIIILAVLLQRKRTEK